jgi:RimJ/RimL family protein N-acetyltransferase
LPSCFIVGVIVNKVIETDRLLLQPLRADDGPRITSKIDNYDISKNLARVPFPYHLSDAEEFLDWALKLDNRSAFRVICLKQNPGELIGLISYDWMEDEQKAELGYWLTQEHWGKGLMTEAACAMVQLAFEQSDLTSLSSCYFNENPASGRVLAKAGFVSTGPCQVMSRARNETVEVTTMFLHRDTWRKEKAAPQAGRLLNS